MILLSDHYLYYKFINPTFSCPLWERDFEVLGQLSCAHGYMVKLLSHMLVIFWCMKNGNDNVELLDNGLCRRLGWSHGFPYRCNTIHCTYNTRFSHCIHVVAQVDIYIFFLGKKCTFNSRKNPKYNLHFVHHAQITNILFVLTIRIFYQSGSPKTKDYFHVVRTIQLIVA
jgi:hypothetical protein